MSQANPPYQNSPYGTPAGGPGESKGGGAGHGNAMAGWALGVAITALVISLAAVMFVAVGPFFDPYSSDESIATEGTVVDLGDLSVGECFTVIARAPETITPQECAEPHDGELYAKRSVAEGFDDTFPGEEEIFWEADDECYLDFEEYVGEAYEDASYSYAAYAPDKQSWSGGDREIACAIFPFQIGSLQGSARSD